MHETLDAPCEFKAAGDNGKFEGYASIFGNKDLGDDVIVAGAFESVKTTNDVSLRIPLFHDLRLIVAKAKYRQDSTGLHIDGLMNMKLSYAPDAYELMKDGSLDSLSVGFNILPGGTSYQKDPNTGRVIRVISKAELWEASIVPFGMNPLAKIDAVKSAMPQDFASIAEVEDWLRDAANLSRKDAKSVIAKFKPVFNQRDADQDADLKKALINNITALGA